MCGSFRVCCLERACLWTSEFRFSLFFSDILPLTRNSPVVAGRENHRLTASQCQRSHMFRVGLEPRQWRETASSKWQCLRLHSHRGRPEYASCMDGLVIVGSFID